MNDPNNGLLQAVREAIDELDAGRPKIGSVAQACAAVIYEMEQLWVNAMYAVQGSRELEAFQSALVRIAAIACRAARDLQAQHNSHDGED
jgi:hypothetical protein